MPPAPAARLAAFLLLLPLAAAGQSATPDGDPSSADSTITAAYGDLLVFDFRADLAPGERRVELGVSFLEPGSETVTLLGQRLEPGVDYRLEAELGRLEIFGDWPGGELRLSARRRPLALPRLVALSPLRAWQELAAPPEGESRPAGGRANPFGSDPVPAPGPGTFELGGSKSLVLRLGSNQDLALEQSLRLSLQGRLSDSTTVEAILRDDDLPFQPEGNTERLEELDKVYLRIRGPAGSAQVGDFVFTSRDRQLTPFSRDFQGIDGTWTGGAAGASAWLARSRGRFRTEEFFGEEGLQGPYELLSALRADGAVILAGSEEVWLNGRRLTRGRERDYTIDYDLGTLSFTSRVPVGAGDIIRVDFRFSQESWRRGAWGAGARGSAGGLSANYFHFEERDDPASPLAFPLDDLREATLATAGDDPDLAVTAGVVLVPGAGRYVLTHENPDDPAQATYAWVDSLGDYNLRFREVGAGAGDYALAGASADGERYYAYAGAGNGSFALGEFLDAPEGYRLESLRLDWRGGGLKAGAEVALSDRDANLLSARDDGDNAGLAALARLDAELGEPAGAPLSLAAGLEERQLEFSAPGARRGAEHYRLWNLTWDPGPRAERRLDAALHWGESGATEATLSGETLSLGDRFDGRRGGVSLGWSGRPGHLGGSFVATATEDSLLGDGHRERVAATWDGFLPLLRGIDLDQERAGVSSPDSADAFRPPERRGDFRRRGAALRFGSRGGREPWRLRWREEWIDAPVSVLAGPVAGTDRLRRLELGLVRGLPVAGRLELNGHYQRRWGFLDSEQFQAENRVAWLARPGGWGGEAVYRLGSRRQRLRQSTLLFVGVGQGDLNEAGVFVGEGEGDYRRLVLLAEEAVRTQDLELEGRLVHEEAVDGGFWARVGSETRLSLREETRDPDLWALARLDPRSFRNKGETLLGLLELREELRHRLDAGDLDLRYRFTLREQLDDRDSAGSREERRRRHGLRARRAGAGGSLELELVREADRRRAADGLGGGSYDVTSLGSDLAWTRHLGARLSATLRLGFTRRRDADRALTADEASVEPRLSLSPVPSLRLEAGWAFRHSSYREGDPAAGRPWFFDAPGWERRLELEATAQAGANLTLAARYELLEEVGRPRRHRLRMESRAFF